MAIEVQQKLDQKSLLPTTNHDMSFVTREQFCSLKILKYFKKFGNLSLLLRTSLVESESFSVLKSSKSNLRYEDESI